LIAFSDILSYHNLIDDKTWLSRVVEDTSRTILAATDFCTTDGAALLNMLENILQLENFNNSSATNVRLHMHLTIIEEIVKAITQTDGNVGGESQAMIEKLSRLKFDFRNCSACIPLQSEAVQTNNSLLEIPESSNQIVRQETRVVEQYQTVVVPNEEEESLSTELLCLFIAYFTISLETLRLENNNEDLCCFEHSVDSSHYLAYVYERVLKIEEKAHDLYLKSTMQTEMATSDTTPLPTEDNSQFVSESFYSSARRGMESFRRRGLAFDKAEVERQREITLQKLKPQLQAMDAVVEKFYSKPYRGHALLQHVYATLPPKKGTQDINMLNRDCKEDMRKAMLKAATQYHPDKLFNKTEGIEWLVLCEEITKRINEYYEFLKNN